MPRRRQMRTAAVVPRAPLGNFPPGKIDPDLRNSETPSVATYVRDINGNWQRCVDAFINVARICAEANTRLTVAEKSELMPSLPFGEATFSKFARIGTDTRLQAPDIQRLLPAHYTTVYHISQLTDEELKQAIAENVIHPNMKRAELQKWHRQLSRKAEHASKPKKGASDSAVVGLIAPTKDAVESSGLPSTTRDDNRNTPDERAPDPKYAPARFFLAKLMGNRHNQRL
jgi:hypothetical protein